MTPDNKAREAFWGLLAAKGDRHWQAGAPLIRPTSSATFSRKREKDASFATVLHPFDSVIPFAFAAAATNLNVWPKALSSGFAVFTSEISPKRCASVSGVRSSSDK